MLFLDEKGIRRLVHASIIVAVLLSVITWIIGGLSIGFIASVSCLVFLVMVRTLVGRGYLRTAVYSTVISLWCVASCLLLLAHGVRDGAVFLYPLLFLFAGLALNRRFFAGLVVVTLVYLAAIGFSEEFGYLSTQYSGIPLGSDLYAMLFILIVIAVCIDLFIMNTRRNIRVIRESKQAIEKADRTKTEFLMLMSHELRSPLNPILGFSSLLEEDIEDPEQKRYLAYIKESSVRLLDMIEAVLEYSCLADGSVPLKPVCVALEDLCEEIQTHLLPGVEAKGLDWGFSCQALDEPADKAFTLTMDRDRVVQVIRHLLSNAIRYSDSGRVEVELRVECDGVEGPADLFCRIEDSGPGIAPEDADAVYEPFKQLDEDVSKRSGSGLGLGLATCSKLVNLMGGSLSHEPAKSGGTCFTCRIPVTLGTAERELAVERTPAAATEV